MSIAMAGDPGLVNSLFITRRQIGLNAISLTEEEKQTALSLHSLFPQHSRRSLMAVVCLHSKDFRSSPGFLMEACTEFLLGEDGDVLAEFLHPSTWGELPEVEMEHGSSSTMSSDIKADKELTNSGAERKLLSHGCLESGEMAVDVIGPTVSTVESTATNSLNCGSSTALSISALSLVNKAPSPPPVVVSRASSSSTVETLSAASSGPEMITEKQDHNSSSMMSSDVRPDKEETSSSAEAETSHHASLESGMVAEDVIRQTISADVSTATNSLCCTSSPDLSSGELSPMNEAPFSPSAVVGGTSTTDDILAGSSGTPEEINMRQVTVKEKEPEQPRETEIIASLDGGYNKLHNTAETELSLCGRVGGKKTETSTWRSNEFQKSPENKTLMEYDDSSCDSLPDVSFLSKPPKQEPNKISEKAQSGNLPRNLESFVSETEKRKRNVTPDSSNPLTPDTAQPLCLNSMLSWRDGMPKKPVIKPEKPESGRPLSVTGVHSGKCEQNAQNRLMGSSDLHSCGLSGTSVPAILDTSNRFLNEDSHKKKHRLKNAELSGECVGQINDSPVLSCEDLPTLSPPKRKRQNIVQNDGVSLLSKSPLASSNSVKYLGKTSTNNTVSESVCSDVPSAGSTNMKPLGKKSPACCSTDSVSCEFQSAGSDSVVYLDKKSPTSFSVKPHEVSSKRLSVNCSNKTSPSKSLTQLSSYNTNGNGGILGDRKFPDDYSGRTLSHDTASTSYSDLTDVKKIPPIRTKAYSCPQSDGFFSACGMTNSNQKPAEKRSTEPHSYKLSSDLEACIDSLHALKESAIHNQSLKKSKTCTGLEKQQSVNKPSASATSGPPIPDTRSFLQKRVDDLNARLLGLIGSADSLCADVHAVKPQAALSSGTSHGSAQQMVMEHQYAPFPNHSELTLSSANKPSAVSCSQNGQSSLSVYGSSGGGIQDLPQTAVTVMSAAANRNSPNKETKSREVKNIDHVRECDKADDVSDSDSFTAYRDQRKVVASVPGAVSELLDMEMLLDQPAEQLLSAQSVPPLVTSTSNLQQSKPVLQNPELLMQQPKSALKQEKPVLQPAKLGVQQHKPVLQPPKLVVDLPASYAQQPPADTALGLIQEQTQPDLYQLRQQPRPEMVQYDPMTAIVLDDSQDEPMIVEDLTYQQPADVLSAQPEASQPEASVPHPGLAFGLNSVLEVFPGADQGYVSRLLEGFLAQGSLDHALNLTMDQLLQDPPPMVTDNREVTVVHVEEARPAKDKDYYKDYNDKCSYSQSVAADRLSMEFRNVRMETINAVLKKYNGHYAPAYHCLRQAIDTLMAAREEEYRQNGGCSKRSSSVNQITLKISEGESREHTIRSNLMKGVRAFAKWKMHEEYPDLLAEIDFINQRSKEDKEEIDRRMAWSLLESEYEEQGQSIECGCCFAEHPFENLVQCFEGHLFCCQCLLGYAREAIFGSGKLNLTCMTADCDSAFPKSQLVKALPDDILRKYDERMAEENLNKAAIEDLVRCPSCNMAVVLDAHIIHFQCPNSACRKEMCRKCKEDWSDHRGKTCDQVEKKDETKLRTTYEEKMTAARVRTCASCQAQFFKEEGCNKMTCRCGATMCYICRTPHISYKHFCQHPRDPGKECAECKKCFLWSNPEHDEMEEISPSRPQKSSFFTSKCACTRRRLGALPPDPTYCSLRTPAFSQEFLFRQEDEKRAILEIQREAQEKRKVQGFYDEKLIGAPEEPATKKRRSR